MESSTGKPGKTDPYHPTGRHAATPPIQRNKQPAQTAPWGQRPRPSRRRSWHGGATMSAPILTTSASPIGQLEPRGHDIEPGLLRRRSRSLARASRDDQSDRRRATRITRLAGSPRHRADCRRDGQRHAFAGMSPGVCCEFLLLTELGVVVLTGAYPGSRQIGGVAPSEIRHALLVSGRRVELLGQRQMIAVEQNCV